MSQENVETVRRYHVLLNETGEPPLDLVDRDVEIHMFEGSPIRGPYRGHQGLQQWREDTFDVIEDWRASNWTTSSPAMTPTFWSPSRDS